jgi:hypothetical protein
VRRLAFVAVLTLVACTQGGARLSVDVRTDLSPGHEFTGAHTVLDARGVDHLPSPSEDWLRGARVAELDGLARGSHTLDVTLLSGTTVVASRRVSISLLDDLAVTVVIPRSCAGVTCPGAGDPASATTCVDGRCASPACGTSGAPPCPGCTTAGDCAPSPIDCAPTECSSATCLRAPDDARCTAGLTCDVVAGCVSPADAGTPDAGALDAGPPDAGPSDAATDLGPPPPWDGGPYASCTTCTHDSDCPVGSLCFHDPHEMTQLDCFQVGIGSCPSVVYTYGVKAFSIDGTSGMACIPVAACSAMRAFGAPCTIADDCGTRGACGGPPGRCTYACGADHDCLAGTCGLATRVCE